MKSGLDHYYLLGLLLTTSLCAMGAPVAGRYALILSDAPAAQTQGLARAASRSRIEAAQTTLRAELLRRQIPVTGAVQIVMNAVFVQAPADRMDELKALPGVLAVVPVRKQKLALDKAVQLQNVPAAWAALGGTANAGAGVKIAILDTGIDITHSAFQDPSLTVPQGYPKCQGADCNFTNNKVIVARSYVSLLAAGTPPNPPADSRPDDLSPRDHFGHGTALGMISAGRTNTGPSATITGLAPKAWLGNYRVFGSPGVNDFTGDDVVLRALEDALNDGMDIAVMSFGGPAFSGPLDKGAICGNPAGVACDLEPVAVENAIAAGMLVVIAAGNEGDTGAAPPTYSTIDSPGTAPSALTAGATTNGHVFLASVRVPGPNVPANLQKMAAAYGDGPPPSPALTAPLKDVANLDSTGIACAALPGGSLSGSIALVLRGTCFFSDKVQNSYNAGAVGVIIIQSAGGGAIFGPGGLAGSPIPAGMISDTDGANLKTFLSANPTTQATMDSTLAEFDVTTYNTMASFSSRGPTIDGNLKPDMSAIGTDMYMATQHYDSNGFMYDPSGYTVADGTSFSTPTLAGAAALVKQKNPGFTPAQLKSAVVNSATQGITDNGVVASVEAVGGGQLDAGAAIQALVTSDPATVSFGALSRATAFPVSRALRIHFAGTAAAALTLGVTPAANGGIVPTLDKTSLSVVPGQADQNVNVSLAGPLPAAGRYEGALTIQGGGTSIRIPYLYVVGDGVPFDFVGLSGGGFDGAVGQQIPDGLLAFRLIDRYGVGVTGTPIQFSVTRGGGQLRNASTQTGAYGIATAEAYLGPNPGSQQFLARGGGFSITFSGTARIPPAITPGGVVNAASFQAGQGIVPGSYISIFGTNLSNALALEDTAVLPVSLADASVSFDVPSAGLSLPARFIFVSPGQINVQVPWELPSGATVQMKVTIGFTPGPLFSTQVVDFSPAVYANTQGLAAALDENFAVVTSTNPVRRGHVVQLFVNGLGQVDNRPATGDPALASPLSHTPATPIVTIGGTQAQVQFSGLAPGFAGLNQINAVVPSGINAGNQQVVVSMGTVSSPAVTLPVQ